ncbi:putative Ig domain-containing protein [Flavobacterium sp.]|uniref:putative Ig domain-containing protein n=1 Tax=Flavobacterium sp. TaxID=239 RepID=UPI0028BD63AC|nr:putative Ig domain-containing protein [Flavobacterium sp.]
MKKIFTLLSLILLTSTFSGCEVLADCLINGRAKLYDRTFPTATVGNYYSEKVGSEVTNEPNDDNYYYNFDVAGEIPPGLVYSFDYRDVHFYGVPDEPGTYTFTIYLNVDHKDIYEEDCFNDDTDSKTYSITVE